MSQLQVVLHKLFGISIPQNKKAAYIKKYPNSKYTSNDKKADKGNNKTRKESTTIVSEDFDFALEKDAAGVRKFIAKFNKENNTRLTVGKVILGQ